MHETKKQEVLLAVNFIWRHIHCLSAGMRFRNENGVSKNLAYLVKFSHLINWKNHILYASLLSISCKRLVYIKRQELQVCRAPSHHWGRR